ncbi:patatin-like phospholipase family protein [Mycolicibacillus trivialis]|uniref:Patatin n=1 Tax=Mycolicibacillus trivialis TaxID=1798 RepID=A0A1X2EL93_9MYCO|nr:patatin-like phospholipase family protein [Mycolicibacillus trivialis]ORX05778.1 patatin [Mycolicibacillus trivialis]
MTRALVLAGGGVTGIAWETGVLYGILEVEPEVGRRLLDSDVLVGTSAGSAVAAQLGSGAALADLFDRQVAAESAELDPGVSGDEVAELFLAAMLKPDSSTRDKLRDMGAVALSAETVAEPVRRAVIAVRLPSHDWPDRALRITAIDIATADLVVFDRTSGVELVDAVAASCSVPGVWPPVTIGERRYMDGGVASSVNLGVAHDCDTAVVLVPAGEDAPAPFGAGPADEIAAFPGRAFGVFADADSLAAFGSNVLDPSARIGAARAGREQGRRVADSVGAFLELD